MKLIPHRLRPLILAAAAGLCAAGAHAQDAAAPADPSAVIATVNGAEITQGDYERALSELDQTLGQVPEAQRRDYVISFLTDLEVISQHAAEQGIDEEEAYREKMEFLGKKAMTAMFLDRAGEEAATDEALRALYEETVGAAEPEVEVRARHILVETEEEATEIVGQLEGGASFEDLAEEKSQDTGSAAQGGDLGYFTRDRMVQEFADAAFALEPGEVSEPVKSQFGWHVIKVEDKREAEKPSLEEVRAQLRSIIARKAQREAIAGLRAAAEIEIVGQEAEESEAETPSEAVPEASETPADEPAPADKPAEDAN